MSVEFIRDYSRPQLIAHSCCGSQLTNMQDFKQLKVWEKAHNLTLDVYGVTATFPREELYGLTSQARRCSASIPANIAERCGRTAM